MVDSDLSSQYHVVDADIGLGIEIVSLPFIESGIDDIDLDIQIAHMVSGRLIPFVGEFDIRACSDGCRYFYVQGLFDFFQSSIGQWFAVFRVDFSAAAACRTGSLALHDAEGRLDLLDHAAMTIAGLAFLLICSSDFLHPGICYLLGDSCIGFFEADIYGYLDVFSALAAFSPRSSAESAAENTAHDIADVEISEIETSLASSSETSKTSLTVES